MNSIERKHYIVVAVSALIQGILLGVYAVSKSGPLRCMPLTVIFIVPFAFWLSQEHWGRRLVNFLAGLTAVLLVLWLYRLWSLYSPNASFYAVPSQKSELIRASMAAFLLIPFFQCRIASWSWKVPYSEIFFQLCRNLFLLFQASMVIAVFWGLLVTAGLLFDIVGLDSIPSIIFNPVTAVPLSCMIIAISMSVAIKHPGIDSLGRWILSVLAWLLPFFSVLSLIFIMCLPFSGLQTLWSTGQASTLMLLLQFGTIILANAAWLDGAKSTFRTKSIDRLAQVSLLCLPVYTVLCLYSLSLRISQYGLTTDRVQAVFLAVVTGIWGFGYAGAVILRKWPSSIGRVNVACVIFMAVIVAAMNSPVLDPYRLAASSQIERLYSGQIKPEQFDYIYTRFSLGRYGNNVLDELSRNGTEEMKAGVKDAMSVDPAEYAEYIYTGLMPLSRREYIIRNARVYPEGRKLTENQVKYISSHWKEYKSYLQEVHSKDDIAFVFADAEFNKPENMIIFTESAGLVFRINNNDNTMTLCGIINGNFDPDALSDFRSLDPVFRDVEINGRNYQITAVD